MGCDGKCYLIGNCMAVIKNLKPYKIVKEALVELKPNEKKVISGRFGIGESRKTLSAIGKELGLSRERIRQVEKEALKRLAANIIGNEKNNISEIVTSFEKSGGIVSHNKIADKFLDNEIKKDVNEFNSLNLIFTLIPQLKQIKKTRELETSWIMSTMQKEDVLRIINDWVSHLEKSKKPSTIDVLVKAHPGHSKYEVTFLSELPHVSKKLVKTETGHIGLSSWPEVNPKNVRDKIYYILNQAKTPLHFDTIAKNINEQNFSKKKVVRATVHNELITDRRFVLVGRGIYALSEWGYKPGTVEEIITGILSENGQLSVKEIIDEVSKQRSVKKNTILINLQTKPEFTRVGKDIYSLRNKN